MVKFTCRISNNLILIVFLRIISGSEDEFFNLLTEFKNQQKINIEVFKGLGRYDVLLLFFTDNLKILNTFRKNVIKYICEFYPLISFKWDLSDTNKKKILTFKQNVIGVSLIKINFDDKKNRNIKNELKLLEQFRGENNIIVCGGIGYYELIIIVLVKNFEKLNKKIEEIRKKIFNSGVICLDLTTIPGINYEWVFKNKELKNINEFRDDIQIFTLLSLNLGCYTSNILKILKNYDKNLNLLFGFHDIIFEKTGNTQKIIKDLIQLRKDLANENLFPSTFTLIKHPYSREEENSYKKKETIDLLQSLKNLIEIKSGQEGSTKYIINIYNQLMQNPYTRHLFLNDIKDLITNITDKITNEKEKFRKKGDYHRYRGKIIEYNMLIKAINYSFTQRMSGIYLGDLIASNFFNFENYGSINRLIFALEAFPKWLFIQSGKKWNGFCCFGLDDRYCGYVGNIFNLPRKTLFNLEEWWGIIHEICHNLEIEVRSPDEISFLNISSELKEEFNNTLQELHDVRYNLFKEDLKEYFIFNTATLDEEKEKKIILPWFQSWHWMHDLEFIYESIPIALDFFIAWCPDKRELYYKKVGKYLEKEFNLSKNQYYLARLAFTKIFELYLYDSNGEIDKIEIQEIEKILKKFFKYLQKLIGTKFEEENINRAIAFSLTYIKFVKIYYKWFKDLEHLHTNNLQRKEQLLNNILNGIIDISFEYSPLDVLHAIFEIEELNKLNNKCRITAFLYLYNYSIKN
ncbi:MAG: hypothetical protein ACTSO9_19420 [Candidatus Helarchaeota archaeon]